MSEKLQKVLANLGLGSRRGLETWIDAGRVKVNGKVAKLYLCQCPPQILFRFVSHPYGGHSTRNLFT